MDEIRTHGREAYPEECCGALLGRKGEPAHVVRVERLAHAEHLSLLGFFHSHPDQPAAPSVYDRDHAFPFFHYLVCAVEGGVPAEVTAWTLLEETGEFEREAILEERT